MTRRYFLATLALIGLGAAPPVEHTTDRILRLNAPAGGIVTRVTVYQNRRDRWWISLWHHNVTYAISTEIVGAINLQEALTFARRYHSGVAYVRRM